MSPIPKKPILYRHFILSLWEERDDHGRHVTWRFSVQNAQKEERIGFKTLDEVIAFLQDWMKQAVSE